MACRMGARACFAFSSQHGRRCSADDCMAGVDGIMNQIPLLTILVFLPLAGAFLLLFLGGRERLARIIALSIGLVETLLACSALTSATTPKGFFLFEDLHWIETL